MVLMRNILFLLVDDGGFELGPYGNNITKTHHINRLAAEGTVFDRAYTAVSSCSPSRAAILTGLPTHQNGMYGLHQFPGNFQSNGDVTSVVNILNDHGYKTGIIGKHHVGPLPNYNFQFGTNATYCWAGAMGDRFIDQMPSCHSDYNNVSRNLTNIKMNARTFFAIEPMKPFFLYVGFGDTHRCGFKSAIGSFCEFYGSGRPGQGAIPDWSPTFFSTDEVVVPQFLPDTHAVRADIAAQYTAVNRMDQGVGVLLAELESAGEAGSTLVFFFSDNGIPFPSGKTNFFEQGHGEPLIMRHPHQKHRGQRSAAVVSSLDFVPTMLAWAGLSYPHTARAGRKAAILTGSSLLPLLDQPGPASGHAASNDSHAFGAQESNHVLPESWRDTAFGSHQFHSLYAYYPMRTMRDGRYRLIHNLAHHLQFAILEDVETTDTWKMLQNGTTPTGNSSGWIYSLDGYLQRPEYQLFDMATDPMQLHNLASSTTHHKTLHAMQAALYQWRAFTNDPWLACNPQLPQTPPQPDWQLHSQKCSF